MQRIAGSLFGGLASKQKYSGGMKIFDMSKYIMSNLIRMCIYQQNCVLAFAEFIQTIVMESGISIYLCLCPVCMWEAELVCVCAYACGKKAYCFP